MNRKMGYDWHLRQKMAECNLFHTSDLVPLLAERGVTLSREQVYRLATSAPQRMSMNVLVALCDILDCSPNDLIEPKVVNEQQRKAIGSRASAPKARRTTIRRPKPYDSTS